MVNHHKLGCMCSSCLQKESNIENAFEREKIGKSKCWNCGKIITNKNRKKHYPFNATMFCKEN